MSSGNEIFARARTIASQSGSDANQSTVIDSLGGLRALLESSIREVYRDKAKDQRFLRDITVRNTVAMTAGTATVPDEIFREYLHQAEFQDVDNSLISYFNYGIDSGSGQTFDQLGYVTIQGDTFYYTPPAPGTPTSYTNNLYVTVPSFPELPASMANDIPMTAATTDDVVLFLSLAIRGQAKFEASVD